MPSPLREDVRENSGTRYPDLPRVQLLRKRPSRILQPSQAHGTIIHKRDARTPLQLSRTCFPRTAAWDLQLYPPTELPLYRRQAILASCSVGKSPNLWTAAAQPRWLTGYGNFLPHPAAERVSLHSRIFNLFTRDGARPPCFRRRINRTTCSR